jgi:hypothetical protein
MDRKDMLIQADLQAPKVPKDAKKLDDEAVEGIALKQMSESRGWKVLMEKFIKPRSHISRILQAIDRKGRDEACGAVDELLALTNFVEGHIKDGYSALEQLEAIKKQGRK